MLGFRVFVGFGRLRGFGLAHFLGRIVVSRLVGVGHDRIAKFSPEIQILYIVRCNRANFFYGLGAIERGCSG